MKSNLKRDQLPPEQAQNWRENFEEEKRLSFNLKLTQIVLLRETYKFLAGENENRIRIYLGLEPEQEQGRYVLCAYAVSAFLLGSGDVYVDYEIPVFKLGTENVNYSDKTKLVVENIQRYYHWRNGDLDSGDVWAAMRKYIYPRAYLLTKYELHEIFNVQNKKEAEIGFGISKTMNLMIYPEVNKDRPTNDPKEVFDFTGLCPPYCDEGSIYTQS
jgi:hypothetical protein